jgi:hypothetical protein
MRQNGAVLVTVSVFGVWLGVAAPGVSPVAPPPPTHATTTTSTSGAPAHSEAVITVTVPGTVQWVDTGIDLKAGDRVAFTATGTVEHSAPDAGTAVGPDGDPSPEPTIYNLIVNNTRLQGRHAGLIGKFGDDVPFSVGSEQNYMWPHAGRLSLGINDNGVDNNSGHFDVTLSIQRALAATPTSEVQARTGSVA